MSSNDIDSEKQRILGEILLKKEDTLRKLEEIVKASKEHFQINEETKEIVFENHIKSIPNKILLFLIGLFIMKEAGLRENSVTSFAEISSSLGIVKTSLSKPLGLLVNKGLIKKDDSSNYTIAHYKILEILGDIKNG